MVHTTQSGLRSFVILLVVTCGWLYGVLARADDPVPTLMRVPLFFITDRNLVGNEPETGPKFGPHRKYIGECLHDPFMGKGYYVVANLGHKRLTPELTALGWAAADAREKAGTYKIELTTGKDFAAIQNQFYSEVSAAALKSEHKDVVLFAHGYNNSFDAALHTASRISYHYEDPVILYSWPSVAKLRSYDSDENNNEWSQEHFNDVLVRLGEVCTTNPSLHLRTFAHSMGSRLVVRGTPYLREKKYLSEVILVCPDVDKGLVNHYARRYLSVNGTAEIRLYMSQRDKALVISQLLHGGYCRLGECADSISALVSTVVPIPGAKAASTDETIDPELKAKIEQTKRRMQTIDFTDLDTGMLGHKIPVELMYNMSYSNQPGSGLELIDEASGQRNRSSRFLSKMTHLKLPGEHETNMSLTDKCLKVVKSDRH
jgi:hypothetical protein